MQSISGRAEVPLKGHGTVVALFQESAGAVYSFLKQHLLKRGSIQKPVELRFEWLHSGWPGHVTAD